MPKPNKIIQLQKKDVDYLTSVVPLLSILSGGLPDRDREKVNQMVIDLSMHSNELSQKPFVEGTSILNKEYAKKTNDWIDKITKFTQNRIKALEKDKERPHSYELSLLHLMDAYLQVAKSGTAPLKMDNQSGGPWIVTTMLPQLKCPGNPEEMAMLEQQAIQTPSLIDMIHHGTEGILLDSRYQEYILTGKPDPETEESYRKEMVEADKTIQADVEKVSANVDHIRPFFANEAYLMGSGGFGNNRGLGGFKDRLIENRHFRRSRLVSHYMNEKGNPEGMENYFQALDTEEEKLDFLLSLQHMSISSQLTAEETMQLKRLTFSFFYPKEEGTGEYQIETVMRRQRMLNEAEERMKAQLSGQVWQNLTNEEKEQVRKYHQDQAASKENLAAEEPVFPVSVQDKYWDVRRGSNGAVLDALDSLKKEVRDIVPQEVRSVSMRLGYDTAGEYAKDMESKMAKSATERVKNELSAYKPEFQEGYDQLGKLGKAPFGTQDEYLHRKYPSAPGIAELVDDPADDVRVQILEEENVRLDQRWLTNEAPPKHRHQFFDCKTTLAIKNCMGDEEKQAIRERNNRLKNFPGYADDPAANQLVRDYLDCKTPDQKAAFVNKLLILKDAGLLTQKEETATTLIFEEFIVPYTTPDEVNQPTVNIFQAKECMENLKAFRRLMDENALKTAAKAQETQKRLDHIVHPDDRREIADHHALHTTTEGATLTAQDQFLHMAMGRIPKYLKPRLNVEFQDVDRDYRVQKQLELKHDQTLQRGMDMKSLNRLQLGEERYASHKRCMANYLKCNAAASYQPTWRRSGEKWTSAESHSFIADTMSKLENKGPRNITPVMVDDLEKLANEIKDADRFFYINGDAYKELRDALRAAANKARELQNQGTLRNQASQLELQPYITRVDKACGEYILSHSTSRLSRHGDRRFNVALMTNALLNPEAAFRYNNVTVNSRGGREINFQQLKGHLNLQSDVKYPKYPRREQGNQAANQAQNGRQQNHP